MFHSLDGGDTWTHLETGLYHADIHSVTVAATQPKRLYASTAREVFTSNNLGETWQPLGIKEKWPLPYARVMVIKTKREFGEIRAAAWVPNNPDRWTDDETHI